VTTLWDTTGSDVVRALEAERPIRWLSRVVLRSPSSSSNLTYIVAEA